MKLQNWRAFQSIFGLEGAQVLEFVLFGCKQSWRPLRCRRQLPIFLTSASCLARHQIYPTCLSPEVAIFDKADLNILDLPLS
jgi:hypothetical protein